MPAISANIFIFAVNEVLANTKMFIVKDKKLLLKKKMLISTNLSLPAITKFYSERICSRLIGDFRLFKFYSDDIRITLNLNNMRKA